MGIIAKTRLVLQRTFKALSGPTTPRDHIDIDQLNVNQTTQESLTPGQSVRLSYQGRWYELAVHSNGAVFVKRQDANSQETGPCVVLTQAFNIFANSAIRVALEEHKSGSYLFTIGALPLVEWTNSTPYILPEGEKVRMQIGGEDYLLEREYDCFAPNKYILTKVLKNGRAERCSVNTQERQKVLSGTVNIQLVTRPEGFGVYLSLAAKIDEEPTIVGPINTESTLIMGNIPLPRAVLEPRSDKGIEFSRTMLTALRREIEFESMNFAVGGVYSLFFKLDPASLTVSSSGDINDYNVELSYAMNTSQITGLATKKTVGHLRPCLERVVTAYNNREDI